MVARVSLPEANLVPLQPPLALQLLATGEVDQVSTGARLPVADVLFAEKLMVPAVWACAAAANASRGSTLSAFRSMCIFQSVKCRGKALGFRRLRECWDARAARGRAYVNLRTLMTVANRRINPHRRAGAHARWAFL